MEELQKAIEKITYKSEYFPEKEFEVIRQNKEAAIPYLRQALEKAVLEGERLDETYQLHFYALFLLGEFQDRESFPKIMELASLPEETLDCLIGDAITSGLPEVLYNTYDGNLELLKNSVLNTNADAFARMGMLRVMGQLYLDGTLDEGEWKAYIKSLVYDADEYDAIYNELALIICQCHFVDLLPEIRALIDRGLVDEDYVGEYDAHVDCMFEYREDEKNICDSPINATKMLKGWAMFEKEESYDPKKMQEFEKMLRNADREYIKAEKKKKIGRNDPCPCGSGRKYKFCCMNKPKSPLELIESEQERKKWLESYPETGKERQEDRVYIEDYFDSESIKLDKILYLALMHRSIPVWIRDKAAEEKKKKAYLEIAFAEFMKRIEEEQIQSFAEYDEKYSIHYQCEEWLSVLYELSEKSGDKELSKRVEQCCKQMNGRQKAL